ncbi:GNAT family N-acetyltransferase [Robiginitalea sp. IMCC44478]|uniref:GNAT family N-acetyltransferase n=1 Tax=Robiginitalea sp. IMCC44478 TaxID=3459122 RepID=UPI0040415C8B
MEYRALKKQFIRDGQYAIIPIRNEDRYSIMKWRNEQLYHLRQASPLTPADQDAYFRDKVSKLFSDPQPEQLLFSYLEGDQCIGYGGLVHINWVDKNAEISFLINTDLEEDYFEIHWSIFLGLIEQLAFNELELHKIYTYAYDLRPRLYDVLEKCNFKREATLKEHCFFDNKYIDVIYHSKINRSIKLRPAEERDKEITFEWASDKRIRKYSFNQNPITRENHLTWFSGKLHDDGCRFYIAEYNNLAVGSFRLDINDEKEALISFLLSPEYHGLGLGYEILKAGIEIAIKEDDIKFLTGDVMEKNKASRRIFEKLGFRSTNKGDEVMRFKLEL